MREIRLSGSEGGGAEMNRLFLPLSNSAAARSFPVPVQLSTTNANCVFVVATKDSPNNQGLRIHGLLPNRAVQFTTRVSGLFVLLAVIITNRFPSAVTS